MQSHREQQEKHAAATKDIVNNSVNGKFVDHTFARRMLQHPHYGEVSSVITDITSQISKEIAANPRRRPQSGGAAATGKSAPAIRMSPGSAARKTAGAGP